MSNTELEVLSSLPHVQVPFQELSLTMTTYKHIGASQKSAPTMDCAAPAAEGEMEPLCLFPLSAWLAGAAVFKPLFGQKAEIHPALRLSTIPASIWSGLQIARREQRAG